MHLAYLKGVLSQCTQVADEWWESKNPAHATILIKPTPVSVFIVGPAYTGVDTGWTNNRFVTFNTHKVHPQRVSLTIPRSLCEVEVNGNRNEPEFREDINETIIRAEQVLNRFEFHKGIWVIKGSLK